MRLRVLSSLQDGGNGTLITFEEDDNMERAAVTGIAFDKNQARINVRGVPDKPGVAYQILGAVADANIEVDMIIQNVGSEGTTDFSFTVPRGDYNKPSNSCNNAKTASAQPTLTATTPYAKSPQSAWACVHTSA